MNIEVMKQALETLEDIFGKNKVDGGAITALRQAIEQAESHEPVAWIVPVETHGGDISQKLSWTKSGAGLSGVLGMLSERFPLYQSPQKHAWVGLTDANIAQLRLEGAHSVSDKDFSAIEAKIKEKNDN